MNGTTFPEWTFFAFDSSLRLSEEDPPERMILTFCPQEVNVLFLHPMYRCCINVKLFA
jgi:hypothetical protein